MFSTEEHRIHNVRRALNVGVRHVKSDRVPDYLPSLPSVARRVPDAGPPAFDDFNKTMRWKSLFNYYDDDGGNSLSFKEFTSMVRNTLRISESKLTERDLRLLFERIDYSRNGEIEFDEFYQYIKLKTKESEELPRTLGRAIRLALRRLRVRTENDIKVLFENLDFDADGGITLHQLRRLVRETLRLNQHEFSDFYIKRLLQSIDRDNTGQIEFGEFVKFIRDHIHIDGTQPKGSFDVGLYASDDVITELNRLPVNSPAMSKEAATSSSSRLSGSQSSPVMPYIGEQKCRGYLKVPGAERLNRVEGRLLDAGFDIRGEFFKVAEAHAETVSRNARQRARPNRLSKTIAVPSLELLASKEGGGFKQKKREPGLSTMYLREVAKDFL